MMNEARLGVGMAPLSLGYTGYLKSLEYARERPQGRPVLAKDPSTLLSHGMTADGTDVYRVSETVLKVSPPAYPDVIRNMAIKAQQPAPRWVSG